jgi:hypothetical protein
MLALSDREVPASNVLLSNDKRDIVAGAGIARVYVARGATAFVVNNGRDVAVLALHENGSGDVHVIVAGQQINLCTGQQVIITSAACLVDVDPMAGVAVRNQREYKLADGTRILRCEFSLASAISNLHTLKRLSNSPHRYDRVLFGKLCKNAAVMQVIAADKGPYKPMHIEDIYSQRVSPISWKAAQ